MSRCVVFDVETPNSHNDRMSSIGVVIVENGAVCGTYSSLVDPETYFDRFNVMLTGITPESVKDAPSFDRLWEDIGPVMESGLLVAHNAPFDMSVLAKCLRAYCIEAPRFMDYACTVRMGRAVYPRFADHKLDTMCWNLGIPLDHHRADSDALAAAKLLIDYERMGLVIDDYVRTYDLASCRTLRSAPSKR